MNLIIEVVAFILCSLVVAVVVGVTAAELMLKIEGSGGVPHRAPGALEAATPAERPASSLVGRSV